MPAKSATIEAEPRHMFKDILSLIARLRASPVPACDAR
jgi:hypothetical protein